MAEGIYAEVENGFARIQFIDASKRGPALTRLIDIAGPELIDVDSRSGSRKIYIVPESVAREAGLLEAPPLAEAALYPDGDPEESWTVAQLREYAEAKAIDLGDATRKADILAVLVPSSAPTE